MAKKWITDENVGTCMLLQIKAQHAITSAFNTLSEGH